MQLQFEYANGFDMLHKAWCSIEEVPYYFSKSSIKFSRGVKNRQFLPELSISGL